MEHVGRKNFYRATDEYDLHGIFFRFLILAFWQANTSSQFLLIAQSKANLAVRLIFLRVALIELRNACQDFVFSIHENIHVFLLIYLFRTSPSNYASIQAFSFYFVLRILSGILIIPRVFECSDFFDTR